MAVDEAVSNRIGFGRTRGMARVLAVLVATSMLLGVWATAGAQDAHAFAWKDTCTITVYNRTGAQSNVRPYLYLPFPPSPAGLALYVALAATGVPTSGGFSFSNTGFPFTAGCTASLRLSNPGSNVACGAAAPTVGANAFNCDGNSSFKITADNDDIKGNVFIPKGSGLATPAQASALRTASPAAETPRPRPGLLHRADLRGSGWQSASKLSDFGRLGQLVDDGALPASCRSRKATSRPRRGGSSAFARRQGSEAIGSLHGVYANAQQSRQTLQDAVSAHSIGCLARLLASARLQTGVTIRRLSLRSAGARVSVKRLVIRTRSAKRATRTDYLDVAGLAHGRSNAVVLLANVTRPVPAGVERGVIRAVAGRLPR